MKCPYCNIEMEEGALITRMVPKWIKKGEKIGESLICKKHFSYNELPCYRCAKCKKMIIDN